MEKERKDSGLVLALEPRNSHANFMIAGALLAAGELFEERDFTALKEHGNVYPRWECPYNVVAALVDARKNAGNEVKFRVWIKKGRKFEDGEFLFDKHKKGRLKTKSPS